MPKMKNDCSDYVIGDYIPLSFESKLKWKIIQNEYLAGSEHLGRVIIFSTKINNKPLFVYNRPYSFGDFVADGYEFGFGGKNYRVGTKDPDEALYLTEKLLLIWIKNNIAYYEKKLKLFK